MDRRTSFLYIILQALLVIQGASAFISPERLTRGEGCVQEGVNPHPYDCHKYAICMRDASGDFLADYYLCPDSEAFSDTEGTCVPENKIQRCLYEGADIDECGGKQINCANCSVLVFCKDVSGNFIVFDSYNCSSEDKYCDSKKYTCTDEQPPECIPHSDCTSEGVFPDIKNCSIYYECKTDDNELTSITHVCDHGYVFTANNDSGADLQPDDTHCKKRLKPTDCVTVKCPPGELVTVPYPGDDRYYIVCMPDGTNIVFICNSGEIFDEDLGHCTENLTTTTGNDE